MKKSEKKLSLNKPITYLVIILAMVMFIVPLAYALLTALKEPTEFLKNPVGLTSKVTFSNFVNAWKKSNFSSYIINSFIYMTFGTAITVLCSLFISFPIARKYVKHHNFLFTLMMCGMFLPDGTIPQFQILLKLGLYNTRVGYIISVLSIGGVCTMFFTNYLKAIPKEIDEAAIIDGAGYFTFMWRIIVPLAKPAIASMSILTAINIWNDIVKAVIYLSDEKLYPITKGLFVFSGQYSTSWTELMAALIMVALPLVIIYVALQKHVVGGLTAGSVKM